MLELILPWKFINLRGDKTTKKKGGVTDGQKTKVGSMNRHGDKVWQLKTVSKKNKGWN